MSDPGGNEPSPEHDDVEHETGASGSRDGASSLFLRVSSFTCTSWDRNARPTAAGREKRSVDRDVTHVT